MRTLLLLALLLSCALPSAASCVNGLDCRGSGDKSGVWSWAPSPWLPGAVVAAAAGGALWEGGDSRAGRTLWQSVDAAAISGVATLGLKKTFQRSRPSEMAASDRWFAGPSQQSFPSGDVSAIAAIVTPPIAEYMGDHPAVWALAALPVFDMAARVRYRAHWPSDTLGGAAVGVASGLLARRSKTPFILSLTPHGLAVGLKTRF